MILTFPNINGTEEIYMDCLRAICGDTKGKSMADLCCCHAPHTPKLGFEKKVYVDIWDRKLDHSAEKQYFIKEDVLKFLENGERYDVTICNDGIEHIHVMDGYKLLKLMEACSDRQVLFTPLTDLFGTDEDFDNPESHKCVWKPEMTPDYAAIVFPHYHEVWNGGAYFFFKTKNIKEDFERVKNELKNKSWNK